MPLKLTILFLILGGLFSLTHYLAGSFFLYWYLWWFDVFMHFWGGILVVMGLYVLVGFRRIKINLTLKYVLFCLLIATVSWEIFEYSFELYDVEGYFLDTISDIIFGFSGGLLAHAILRRYTMK